MLARIAESFYRRVLKPRVPAWFLNDLIEPNRYPHTACVFLDEGDVPERA